MPLAEFEANVRQITAKYDKVQKVEGEIGRVVQQGGEIWARDDVNDMELPMELVNEARKEEMARMKKKTFKVVKKVESYDVTCKGPISTKWVDTDKSHGQGKMLVRSRWVARDFKTKGERDREDLFCATPPLELIRILASKAASYSRRTPAGTRKMLFIDVKKTHLIPRCTEDVYVELPKEAGCKVDECGKLESEHWLYGCRKAGQAWEDHYSKVLVDAGLKRGQASPVIFFHPERDIWCVVHGDDFRFTGEDEASAG